MATQRHTVHVVATGGGMTGPGPHLSTLRPPRLTRERLACRAIANAVGTVDRRLRSDPACFSDIDDLIVRPTVLDLII